MTMITTVTTYTASEVQHLSYDDCLENKREDYQNCSVLCCVKQLCTITGTSILEVLTDEGFRTEFLARDVFVERIVALLPWCSSVRLSICLSGTGVRSDHTVHFSTELNLWFDSPMFWAPWHQNMSTYYQPSFSSFSREVGYRSAKYTKHCFHANTDK